jgi:hypothetical protein
MNWKQLHRHARKREEILIMMLQLEARQQRIILARGRLLRERRRAARLHFIRDRRIPPVTRTTRNLLRTLTMFILSTISITVFLVSANIQPRYGAPLLFCYDLLLIAMLLIKPTQRISLSIQYR